MYVYSHSLSNGSVRVQVKQMKITIPNFTFELNKSISSADVNDAYMYDSMYPNLEAIYGMCVHVYACVHVCLCEVRVGLLSVKFFGIGISIPLDDSSLCQFMALFLTNRFPLYKAVDVRVGFAAVTQSETSMFERGLRRGDTMLKYTRIYNNVRVCLYLCRIV